MLWKGADGAGGNTLAKQITNLESNDFHIECFCNEDNLYEMGSNRNSKRAYNNFTYFNSNQNMNDLINKDHFDICMILTSLFESDKNYNKFIEFIKNLNCKKVLFNIDRSKRTAKKELSNKKYLDLFDRIICISDEVKKYVNEISNTKCGIFDVNVYKFHDIEIIKKEQRKNVISYIGRFANFKGWNTFFDWSVNEKDLFAKYSISFEGGLFAKTEKSFSSTIGIIACLCNSTKDKDIKGKKSGKTKIHFDYSNYDKDIKERIVHLYPSYNLKEMLKRARKKKFVIFPIGYNKKIEKVKSQFEVAMEYAWLEMIDIGTPIVCTTQYANSYIINGKKLIDCDCGLVFINDYNELNDKLNEYEKNYDTNIVKMKKFFVKNYDSEGKFNKIIDFIMK